MKKVIILLSALAFSLTAFGQAEEKKNVAILMLEVSGGIPQTYAAAMTDRVRQELFSTGVYKVMERGETDEILKEIGFQQTGCTSNECVVQAGKILGANYMISGTVSRVGELNTVTLRLISVETSEIVKLATVDHIGPLEEVITLKLREAAEKLTGFQSEKTQKGNIPIGYGTISINSYPEGAKIFIDEMDINNITPTVKTLSAGAHSLRLVLGDLTASKQLYIVPDVKSKVDMVLKTGYGSLKINTLPLTAEVFLNDIPIGRSPIILDTVLAGDYKIKIKNFGYSDLKDKFRIGLNERVEKSYNLSATGIVYISTAPPKSKIFFDNDKAIAPFSFENKNPGSHSLSVKQRGYYRYRGDFIVISGRTDSLKIELIPKGRGKAFLYSAIIPGSGQYWGDYNKKGAALFVIQVAALGLAYYGITEHTDKVDEYNAAKAEYMLAVGQPDIDYKWSVMNSLHDETKTLKNQRDIFIAGVAAVYAYNLIDILFISKFPGESSQYEFGSDLNQNGIGELTLNINF